DVTPVLVNGRGDILHVGRRTRTVPVRMRKALNLRDGGCGAPGCEVPPDLCTPDHLRHWADGGFTVMSNLSPTLFVPCYERRATASRTRATNAAGRSAPPSTRA